MVDGQLAGPGWLPDGTTLSARRRPDNSLVLIRRENDAWSEPEVLVPGDVPGSYMAWSPNGRAIAYSAVRGLSVVSVPSVHPAPGARQRIERGTRHRGFALAISSSGDTSGDWD